MITVYLSQISQIEKKTHWNDSYYNQSSLRHIFKEMSKQLDLIFWQCKSENISHPKKFLVKKTHKTNHTPQSVFWEIYSMYLKKSRINFTASSVVQLHALVRKRLIANIIYKISCIEALKNISLYSRENYFFKRTHGTEFVWNSST